MYQFHNQQMSEAAYKFFSVSVLKEDKENTLAESNTLAGKWRSLMTGTKYTSDNNMPKPDRVITAVIGAAAGAAIGSVIPIAEYHETVSPQQQMQEDTQDAEQEQGISSSFSI